MKKIVAFGASSSSKSINKIFATYAANQIQNSQAIILDLNNFEMPIYSEDYERIHGIPKKAYEFKNIIKDSDGIIISFAEHNGAYTAAFKNIFDWISRIENIVWFNKPMLLLATSNGSNGASLVLNMAHSRISRGNPNSIAYFSLPNFNDNFNSETGIKAEKLNKKFVDALSIFIESL
ncbi:MAG: NADPH-dependent FMN reductase [Bacteroidota bacterium]|nr:NADPH-dependent FMN reductase [Bacteroidota bacterium]